MYVRKGSTSVYFEKWKDENRDCLYIESHDEKCGMIGMVIPASTALEIGRAIVRTFAPVADNSMPIHWTDINDCELDKE